MNMVRLGMVGGGEGAFIGPIHRAALTIDGRCELVCGALASTPEKAVRSGAAIGLAKDRAYDDYSSMLAAEAALPEELRMQAVVIVTPNNSHFDIARASLQAGFHVFCEKPLVMSMDEARELSATVGKTGLIFGLAHTYAGYPLVHQARALVKAGRIGAIRKIIVEYPQGWLARFEEGGENKQVSWRTDPARAGSGGAIGDIGTHAHQLAEMVSGQEVTQVRAELTRYVSGRNLDDDAEVAFRLSGGGKGRLYASQIAIGEENGLRIRVHGETGSLKWLQEEPNSLWFEPIDEPAQLWRAAGPYLDEHVRDMFRTPMGHPEGYLEAFATLYKLFADRLQGKPADDRILFPDITTGMRGMAFLNAAIESDREGGSWRSLDV